MSKYPNGTLAFRPTARIDVLDDLGRLLIAGGIVATGAIPAGVLFAAWCLRSSVPLLPAWKKPNQLSGFGLGTEGFDFVFILLFTLIYAGLFPSLVVIFQSLLENFGVFHQIYGPSAATSDGPPDAQLKKMWAIATVSPGVLLLWFAYRKITRESSIASHLVLIVRDLVLGIAVWCAITPLVFLVHLMANVVAEQVGAPTVQHPLSQHGLGQSLFDRVFFAIIVCLITPLIEEVFFRGLLVGWATGRRYRPWVLMVLAGGLAVLASFAADRSPGPLVFVVVLGVGLFLVQKARKLFRRFPTRTAASIFSTASLFAIAHSAVWPTPIPLFVLGLGLGYLAARTGGITGCIVLHGLFNAVSFVLLLRGGAG